MLKLSKIPYAKKQNEQIVSVFFGQQKQEISTHLQDFLKKKSYEFACINHWGTDLCNRIGDFTSRGKMVRGGLVILSFSMFHESVSLEVIKTATAMELFHSSFLIHDDIMDKDLTRRGFPTLFYQYKQLGEIRNFPDAYHFGESMGICVGDIAFFLAFEILCTLNVPSYIRQKILKLCAREVTYVGLAQMMDIYLGYSKDPVRAEEILNLYLYKTGRYTLSLPLMLGAILAQQPESIVSKLGKIGEYLGIIFQMKDDEIGLFGNEAEIGKPVGSDIKEKKKTLFHIFLFEKASESQKEKLEKIFGNKNITVPDLQYVRNLVCKLGIRQLVAERVCELAAKTRELIHSSFPIRKKYRQILLELLEYSLERKR